MYNLFNGFKFRLSDRSVECYNYSRVNYYYWYLNSTMNSKLVLQFNYEQQTSTLIQLMNSKLVLYLNYEQHTGTLIQL